MNKNLDRLQSYFDNLDYKTVKYPAIIGNAIKIIDNEVSDKMKLFIAVHECCTLVSNMGKYIRFNGKTTVSTNLVSILFSKSGSGKDQSVSTVRGCFNDSYKAITERMKFESIRQAKEACVVENGDDKEWGKFYKGSTRTLFPSVSTEEGAMNQMDVLQATGIGGFNLVVSELVSDMKSSKDLQPLLKSLAIGYDLGNIPSKIVKTNDLQTNDIKGMNINALMFSSMATLMSDKGTRDKFMELFVIQYARRSLVCVDSSQPVEDEFESVVDMVNAMSETDNEFEVNASELTQRANLVTSIILADPVRAIEIPSAVNVVSEDDFNTREVYNAYKKFCKLRSEQVLNKFLMKKTATKHLHWKALKIASMFAMLSGKMVIEPSHYLQAISVVEAFIDDLEDFQIEVEKEPYELLIDHCNSLCEGSTLIISKHSIIKEGLVASNVSDKKITELLELCSSADRDGVYSFKKGNIKFTKLRTVDEEVLEDPTDISDGYDEPTTTEETSQEDINNATPVEVTPSTTVPISLKMFKNDAGEWMNWSNPKEAKAYMSKRAFHGYQNFDVPFAQLAEVVNRPLAYSPYHFGDGVDGKGVHRTGYRSMATCIDPSSLIVLDVDDTPLNMNQLSEILQDYKHIIATTSDNTNLFKYRVIFELDRPIDLSPSQWKRFYKSVADLLGIEVDTNINKAGMFYGYADSKVIYHEDGSKLPTKPHIIKALTEVKIDKVKVAKNQKELDIQWDEREETFEFAYEAVNGRRTKLYGAMRKACDMGWNQDMVEDLLEDINDEMVRPLPVSVIESTIISQIHKFIKG